MTKEAKLKAVGYADSLLRNPEFPFRQELTDELLGDPVVLEQFGCQVVEPVRKDDWYATENIPVPIGEWFDLEVFWRYGNESTGRVWAKVNGTLVADHKGRTQHPDDPLGIDYWAIFKNYADVPDWGGTTKQWIDDVEIWSDEPEETTPRSCYYQKVICITTPCEPQLVCPAS